MTTSANISSGVRIDGTLLADTLTGSSADEDIYGGAGGDHITGGGGHDRLYGGDGDDWLASGNEVPAVLGHPQTDSVGDLLDGGAGDDYLAGDAGNDTLLGGDGDDLLLGQGGDDVLDGGSGMNILSGGEGDDHYEIHSRTDLVGELGGHDSATVYVDWYKTDARVEDWSWAPGVQKLPYWIDALVYSGTPFVAASLGSARTIYYSFAQTPPAFFDDTDKSGFRPFNSAQVALTKQVLAYIETVADVHFVQTQLAEGSDTIVFANNAQANSAGYGAPLQATGPGARVLIASTALATNPDRDGGAEFLRVVTHEIGHALGLKHPFENGDSTGQKGLPPYLPATEDKLQYTEMSYTGREHHPGTYSPLDIAALHYLYGAASGYNAGDSRYVIGHDAMLIGDGGGIDLIDGSAQTADLTLSLQEGMWSYVGAKADNITSPGQITIDIGTTIENAIGGAGNDRITGNAVANTLAGGAGDDVLQGGGGNDSLDGGGGLDTAVYAGAHTGFRIAQSDGGLTVTDLKGTEGSDTLTGIERLQFGDGALAFDFNGTAGEAYRLYAAAFDREPDLAGLSFWMAGMDKGASLLYVATEFTKSAEFIDMYGASRTPEAFLTKVYQHVLHRAPDAGGYAFWLDGMKHGVSEGEVLAKFGESPENVAQVVGHIQNGIWYTPVNV